MNGEDGFPAGEVQSPVTAELPTMPQTELPAVVPVVAPAPEGRIGELPGGVWGSWDIVRRPAKLSYPAALVYYCLCLVIAFLVGDELGVAGVMLCVLTPGLVIAYYLYCWNARFVTRCCMCEVSIETFLILMVPLMFAIAVIDKHLGMRSSCPHSENLLDFDDTGDHTRIYHDVDRPPFWRYFFQAFVRAALLEESTKYLAVRRIAWKPYVVNARALLCYSALAGCVFGVVENINYGLQGGISTIFVRGFITVPFHTITGVMQGCVLCRIRFGDQKRGHCLNYLQTITIPVLFHGSYDLMLFIQSGECDDWMWSLNIATWCLLIWGAEGVRPFVEDLHRKYPGTAEQDIHRLIEDGTVARPCHCVTCCSCCY